MFVMSATAPRSDAALRGEATRQRVLDAAVACVATEGFQASNLSRIARYAGMTTGAIQHQFGDKSTLLAEIVARGYTRLVDSLARLPGSEAEIDHRVRTLVGALWQAYDADSTRASLETLLAMRGDPAFHERSIAVMAAMHQQIDRLWMGTFWDAPCSRSHHVEAQRTVFNTLNGLALERILVPGSPDLEPDLVRLAGQVLDLLTVGSSSQGPQSNEE